MTKPTIYTFSKCDEADGYFLANCECVCTQTCSDKVTSKPEHSQYVEVDCTACGVSTKIKDHWECDDGYQKSGNSCVLATCPAGFARNVADCGQSGGWTLDTSSQSAISGCYKCSANACPLVAVSGFGTGSATRDVKSSTDNRVSSCGSYAGNGWTVVATGKYSGDEQCFVCRPNACPTGYKPGVSSVADCGLKAADGWSFSASNLANGNDPCGLCSKLKCPGNSSTEISSRKDCDKKYGKNRYYDFNSVIEGYSGDKECHSCSGVQACDEIGLVDHNNPNQSCIEVSVLGYDQKMITCYDCSGGSYDCGQGYILVNGECKPTYESCEAANLYTQPPAGNNYCNNIDIWLPSGQKETCYDCTADGCCETCADHCSWNIENCSGFVHCRTLCERKYGATCSGGYYY